MARFINQAFRYFERAQILGQECTLLHVRAHMRCFDVPGGRTISELVGQLKRIVAASLFSRIWVPKGNTGGANVSALKPMPVPQDLQHILQQLDPGD
jgi:hypothetical protein